MSKVIMVPVHLDGFFLKQEQLVTEAFADFSRLPFKSTEKDYNPDTANISESILSPPFQNNNLNLKKGMHLHWALPDALTKGNTENTVNDYPAVPNRWLITRKKDDAIEKQWVVESDYLTSDVTNPHGSIAYPVDTANPSDQPFQYLGRQLDATGWTEVTATRLSKLTAIGYGEPAFAAFYPNCHSVFGCFDPDINSESQLQGLKYQLIGWYSNTTQDPIAKLLEANPSADQAMLEQAIKDQFAWNVTIDMTDPPKGMVCYAQLTFSDSLNVNLDNTRKPQAASISIGNTGTEALSAYIAGQLNPTNSIQLEEQLEHLLLQTQLQGTDLDLGPRFKEVRHEKGFTAESGGSLWEIKPDNQNNDTTTVVIGLPPGMSDSLDELNSLQQQADQTAAALTRQKHILFADWYKYMLCAYPPDDSRDTYPDIDYVKWYIQTRTIPKLKAVETDLVDKQAALTPSKVLLKAQVTTFNHSMIYSTVLSKQLDNDQADTSGLSLTNTTWEENAPFSNRCLYLNGTDAELSITGIAGIRAISFWVNLYSQEDPQNPDDTVLLATQNEGILISKDQITNFRNTIGINGELYFPSDTEPLQWDAIPKDQWCHLFIVFDTPLQNDTIYICSNNGSLFSEGKLMAVDVFTDKTLLFKELTSDTADTSGLTLTNTAWQDNNPFSTRCLSLNGTDANLSVTGTAIDGMKALSLWVNLATQNADDATLLATASAGALIGKNEITGFWDKIAINGITQPGYKPLQWSSLPKDQWFHLHIEFTEALTNSDTLYLFSNNGTQFLNGKLTAIRLFNDTLSADELYYDQNMLGHEQYQLRETGGPRFWQPREPVVLIEGNAVEPTGRHGEDGRLNEDNTLDCPEGTVNNYPLEEADFSDTELLSTITTGAPVSGEKIGYDTWSQQPWHPFLLEWEVEVFPMEQGGNLDIDTRDFNPAFMTTNYTLKENSPELSVQDGKSVIGGAAIYSGRTVLTPYAEKQLTETLTDQLKNLKQEDCYEVISPITETQKESYNATLTAWYNTKPGTSRGIITTLTDPLITNVVGWNISWSDQAGTIDSVTVNDDTTIVVKDHQDNNMETFTINGTSVTGTNAGAIANPDTAILLTEPENYTNYYNWYLGKPVFNNDSQTTFTLAFTSESERLDDFNYSIIQTWNTLNQSYFISQSLGGFNNALLMHHQTLQLPVNDPLGFADYQTFTNQVRDTIAGSVKLAPLPLNDFLPVRSGTMRLLSLRIIDTFGQVKTINSKNPVKAEPLALPEATGGYTVTHTAATDIWLPPRFIQPVRLNFRWLSAATGSQELNSHPESSPVCGWLLANHLDNSIVVYDQKGNALGVIDQGAKWRSVPGNHTTVDPSDLDNTCLQNVIERLALIHDEADSGDAKKTFIQDFITVTDKALENIDPESFVHHQELALLMGRPIAVVRASLNLELQGGPAIHHGWTTFYQDLERDERETDGFENVTIPIRIGERGQLNDGVLGYWKEDADNTLDTVFHTTVAQETVSNSAIQSYEEAPLHLLQSLSSATQTLTMLVDPRGDVHATTGILPAKSINIPKEYYTDALKKINITFLSAPVLTGADQVALPLPNELGYQWSWLAKDRFSWTETANTGILRKDTLRNTFDNGEALWAELLDKGWIIESDSNRAGIVPTDQRTSAELDAPFKAQTDAIQALLDAGHIVSVNTRAIFIPKQTIKEGWLKLSPSDN